MIYCLGYLNKKIQPVKLQYHQGHLFFLRRIPFFIVLTLVLQSCYTEEETLPPFFAQGYDSHVELRWEDLNAERYCIWVRQEGATNFVERGVTLDTIYLDFVNDLGTNLNLEYKIAGYKAGDTIFTEPGRVQTKEHSEEELLDMVQYYTFRYFWEGAEPNSGMARERYHVDGFYPHYDKHIITTGGTGFGIAAFPAAVDRGWITRSQLFSRTEKMVTFLEKADRFHGIWPHWLDGETGKVKPFSKGDDGGDLVESAFLIQGMLILREYFKEGNPDEKDLAKRIDDLWRSMEWDWYTKDGEAVLYWHWSPAVEWKMDFPLKGYNECLITYILAASSPTHAIDPAAYHQGWARNGAIKTNTNTYGFDLNLRHNDTEQYGGPLFWSHYSFIGLNPKGLKDAYVDYWSHNTNHTLINRQWCIENPRGYKGYGENLWGLTSSYSIQGYAAHHPENDQGVITPTAALSSMPYTPEESMMVLVNMYRNYGNKVFGKFGFYDAFSIEENWFPQKYLAIDQGPILTMIENHRSGKPWELFMGAPEIKAGLEKLGFDYPDSSSSSSK